MSEINNNFNQNVVHSALLLATAYWGGSKYGIRLFGSANRAGLMLAAGLTTAGTCFQGSNAHDSAFITAVKTACYVAAGVGVASVAATTMEKYAVLPLKSALKFGVVAFLLIFMSDDIFRRIQVSASKSNPSKSNPSKSNPKTSKSKPRKSTKAFRRRVRIASETLKAIECGFYENSQGEKVMLKNAQALCKQTRAIDFPVKQINIKGSYKTKITVRNKDCLDVAEECVRQGLKTMVLNPGSPGHPGGDPGFNGVEEHLCYRTELADFMKVQKEKLLSCFKTNGFVRQPGVFYHIYNRMIYVPNVQVFRKSEKDNFAFLDAPFTISVLSTAAPVKPKLTKDGKDYADKEIREKMKSRIRAQFTVAYQEGCEALVLTAFGCGEFKNPPLVIAQLMKEGIQGFPGVFERIDIAIIDKQNEGNFNIFFKIFSPSSKS